MSKGSYIQSINAFRQDTWKTTEESRDYFEDKYDEIEKNHYALGKSKEGEFGYYWKKGFLTAYGRKGGLERTKGLSRLIDPAIMTALELRICIQPKYAKSNIGAVDYINPVVWLALAVSLTSGAMYRKSHQLSLEDREGAAKALRVLDGTFNVLIRLPIMLVAYITQTVFLLVKALVSVFAATGYAIGAKLRYNAQHARLFEGMDSSMKKNLLSRNQENVDEEDSLEESNTINCARQWKAKALDLKEASFAPTFN